MQIQLNPTFLDRQIATRSTNKNTLKLSSKPATEILELAIEARKSNNPHLLDCFTELPTLQELLERKTEIDISIAKTGKPGHTEPFTGDL